MRYKVTLMSSNGTRVPTAQDNRIHTPLSLAIASAHIQLDKVNNDKTVAVIREASPDKTVQGKVVKIIDRTERLTRSPHTASLDL